MFRVLVVDDHAGWRHAARELLQARGYEVAGEADSALTALSAAVQLAPDGVLLDVRLGADDGYRVCRALSADLPHIAVVLMSADDGGHAHRLARLAGACGFVAKTRMYDADLDALFTRSA